jgi:hypothetical protein
MIQMKQLIKFFGIAILVLGLGIPSFAQIGATANASATIVATITLLNTSDLEFGDLAIQTGPGTVILDPMAPEPDRHANGGFTLPATPNHGFPTAARFLVTGVAGQAYWVGLTEVSIILTEAVSGDQLTVDTWTSNLAAYTNPNPYLGGNWHGSLTGGQDIFYIGATVNAAQLPSGNYAPGHYTGGPFHVTVNYE